MKLSFAKLVFGVSFVSAYTINDEGRPDGWVDESHAKGQQPDYQTVFDTNKVHRVDISIPSESYTLLTKDVNMPCFFAASLSRVDRKQLSFFRYF